MTKLIFKYIVSKTVLLKKRGFLLLFFLHFIFASTLLSKSLTPETLELISQSKEWKALLHIRQGKPKIYSKDFLLSYGDFSLENELILTLQRFKEGKDICKYPARYYLLNQKISNLKLKECPELNNYLNVTNPKNIDLVFAAENLLSPSSMMGHVFFKISSETINGYQRKNAVSFYTVIDTFNIPKLIYKSTIKGMKGYFILNPYQSQINKYLYDEGRSIWEYRLRLNEFQKKLILYHFWELKDIDITYYFTGFNCATMIDDILSLTTENYMNQSLWVTPKDVIKNAKRHNLIDEVNMIPSTEWELNMLAESIEEKSIAYIVEAVRKKEFNALQKYLLKKEKKEQQILSQFIQVYAKYLLIKKSQLTTSEFNHLVDITSFEKEHFLNIEEYKNPLNTPDDSSMHFILGEHEGKDFIGVSFLAAANTLKSDNREYFSENSLKLGEIDLRLFKDDIQLHSFDLYSMKLLAPWNNITKPLSKEFEFNFERHKDSRLNDVNSLNISGGVGITNLLHHDMTFYNLLKAGVGLNFKEQYAYTSFETGLIIYEIFNMKTVLMNEFIYNQGNSDEVYRDTTLTQAIFFGKKEYQFNIEVNEKKDEEQTKKSVMFMLNYLF